MGCCVVFFVLGGAPRFALFLMWLFTNRLTIALESFWLGVLGFFFLPFTTVVYAIAYQPDQGVRGFGWILVAFAFMADLTVTFGGGKAERQRRVEYS
jgi:hypothetical protein